MRSGILLAFILAVQSAYAIEPVADAGPLTPAQRAIFEGTPEDEPPAKLNAVRADLEGRHYLTCDENYIDKWQPILKDLGGIYTGVGTDQAYAFIGWMRPKLAWLTDYDPWVKRMHHVYAVIFAEAEDIDSFLAWWHPKKKKKVVALLMEKLPGDEADKKKTVFVYKSWVARVHRRLVRTKRRFAGRKVQSFLTDPGEYTFVRQHVLDGRVRPVLCNLLDKNCFTGLGKSARKLGVPVRALYTSNAEGYWRYSDQFRANMYAQHFDTRSLILRTLASKKRNGDYRYNSQSGQNFQAWLREPYVTKVRSIVPWDRIKDEDDIPVTHIDEAPVNRTPKKKRRRR